MIGLLFADAALSSQKSNKGNMCSNVECFAIGVTVSSFFSFFSKSSVHMFIIVYTKVFCFCSLYLVQFKFFSFQIFVLIFWSNLNSLCSLYFGKGDSGKAGQVCLISCSIKTSLFRSNENGARGNGRACK